MLPTLAGLVIAGAGIAWVYAVNAASFLMVLVALLLMRARPRDGIPPATRITWAAAREGLRFVFAHPIVRSTMLLDFIATFFASATALLPIFAQDILRVGARGYGWLYAAPSVGAVLAGFVTAHAIDRIERRGAGCLGPSPLRRSHCRLRSLDNLLAHFCPRASAPPIPEHRHPQHHPQLTPDERAAMTANMMFFHGRPAARRTGSGRPRSPSARRFGGEGGAVSRQPSGAAGATARSTGAESSPSVPPLPSGEGGLRVGFECMPFCRGWIKSQFTSTRESLRGFQVTERIHHTSVLRY